MTITRFRVVAPLLLIASFAVSLFAASKIKIATVSDEFNPNSGTGIAEPVSISAYYFEVNKETGRARVVIDYAFRNQSAVEGDDAHRPSPTYAQIVGLVYDRSSHTVVYNHDGEKTVCATVREHRGLWRSHLTVKNTGSCVVTAIVTNHVEDDGWAIRHSRALDVYFEAR